MSAEDERPAGPARLLIVDDVLDNRVVLARRFQKRGFEIVEADGGRAALDLIAREPFDAVLLDIVMPDLSGIEVLKTVRKERSPAELPIIMVTARAQSEDVVEALGLGANDYVTKPVDFAIAFLRVEAQVERKRAKEQLLRANAALEGANHELAAQNEALRAAMEAAQAGVRARAEFLRNISHELKTPLNGILGFSQLLAASALDERQRGFVETINASAGNLERLFTHLLDLSSAPSHQADGDEIAFDLAEMVHAAAAPFERAARIKGLTFKIAVAPEAHLTVEGDATRLGKVLSSLLDNAVKFTERGEIELTVAGAENGYRFQIRDTGIGFDPAYKDQVFERFVQVDTSATRRFGGGGLGLSVARQMAQLIGGSVECESVPHRGSVFTLQAPLRISQQDELQPPAAA